MYYFSLCSSDSMAFGLGPRETNRGVSSDAASAQLGTVAEVGGAEDVCE